MALFELVKPAERNTVEVRLETEMVLVEAIAMNQAWHWILAIKKLQNSQTTYSIIANLYFQTGKWNAKSLISNLMLH